MFAKRRPRSRGERRPLPRFPRLEVLEDRSVPAVVGYYDMAIGRGAASQVAPITAAGHTAVLLEDLTASNLAGVDVLFVQNPSNSGYGSEYLSRLGAIADAVAGGKTLILHDRYVTGAAGALPGGAGITFTRGLANDINVEDGTLTALLTGPGGTVSSTNLDNLSFSTHGYATHLPEGALVPLNNGTGGQAVTFAYAYGTGYVVYSAIPLDFQLGRNNNIGKVYGPNVVAWGVDLLNEAPVAEAGAAAGDEDTVVTGTVSATDGDGDGLTFEVVTGPRFGALVLNGETGEYRYTPGANFHGEDRFTFRAFDGREYSGSAEVVLTVSSVNDAPVVTAPGGVTTSEGSVVTLSASASDVEEDALSYFWDFGDGSTANGASVQHVYADDGDYTVTLTVSDGADGTVVTLAARVDNVAPQDVEAGDDRTVTAGQAVTLTGTFTDPGSADTHELTWSVFGAAGEVVASGSGGSFTFTPGAGTYTVRFTVRDDDGGEGSDTFTLAAVGGNAAPVASLVGPASGVRGQPLEYRGGVSDPDAGDAHTLSWAVRDGAGRVVASGQGERFRFTPGEAGRYTVELTATDREGASSTASQAVSVEVVQLQASPLGGGAVDLVVGGTAGRDLIVFEPGRRGQVEVWVNGRRLGSYAVTGRLVAYGQEGADVIYASPRLGQSAWFFGGDGNDILSGGKGHDVLVGGEGIDILMGGDGRDVLIGGGGLDVLLGGRGQDVLVTGRASVESDAGQLEGVWREWTGSARWQERAAAVTAVVTVQDDQSLDFAFGDAGRDLFFSELGGWSRG